MYYNANTPEMKFQHRKQVQPHISRMLPINRKWTYKTKKIYIVSQILPNMF